MKKNSNVAVNQEVFSNFNTTDISVVNPRASLGMYLGIFLTSGSVLLFELALTRIFAVMLWAHWAFMVVGTALFGFGLSGVYLALRSSKTGEKTAASLTTLSVTLSAAMLACFMVISYVPFRMWQFAQDPMNFLYLAIWYSALVVPFFVAGLIIAKILTVYKEQSASLYGIDLIGAALGSLILVPIIPMIGATGCLVAAALAASVAGLMYSTRTSLRYKTLAILCSLGLAILVPKAESLLPIKLHETKRRFNIAQQWNHLYDTHWSPLSRVDVAYHNKNTLDIWIDGGTNESAMIRWDGNLETLEPMTWSTIGTVYDLKNQEAPRALIIGSSGGREVLTGLSHGASHIDAVEMDPSIVKFVGEPRYSEFMGGLYQHEKVTLINDEGRSFVRRQPKGHYDIIQSVNNYTPIAMSSGALNLSAAFLLTEESINDYLDHLSPNGVLVFHRGMSLRLAILVKKVLASRGVTSPKDHILIASGEVPFFDGFYVKNSPWTEPEVNKISNYLQGRPLQIPEMFLWNPLEPNSATANTSLYSEVLNTPEVELPKFYRSMGVKLDPPTDNRPFIEHFLLFGSPKMEKRLPPEFGFREAQKWRGIIPRGDFPYIAILVESGLLALFCIGIPLMRASRRQSLDRNFITTSGFFSCLGFGFIVVEICLMKKYVLFLGNPAYSITTVLVALLCSAGIGSLLTSRFAGKARKNALLVLPLVLGAILLETMLAPLVFDRFLAAPFFARTLIATALLCPLGLVMGMPFALGLSMINANCQNEQRRKELTAWAWGMNGYWTVIGSASTVFIAVLGGFSAALTAAMLAYFIGFICIAMNRSNQH